MSKELRHFGIPGMKWGTRRWQNEDGSFNEEGKIRYGRVGKNYNKNYSYEQRERDRSVYGRGGVRRINRRMNEGASISAARSSEASRIHSTRQTAVLAGNVGATAGSVASYIFSAKYTDTLLRKLNLPVNDPSINTAVRLGIAAVGGTVGRMAGKASAMAIGGYDPRKFRYG